jgi:hypothetical protein
MKIIASFGPWACILAILAGGCAHEPPDGQGGPERGGPPPGGPPFLSGPMGAALPHNADGFVARVTFEIQTPEGRTDVLTGDLIGRGSKFVFTPEATGERGKRLREARISFVWDAADAQGYMLSEALQGSAPLAPGAKFTVGESRPTPGAVKVEGHACEAQDVTVTGSDGSTTSLRVWRAADLKGLPLQIAMQPDLAKPVFRLSKIRQATPSPEIFLTPESFTKYRGVEAMMSELKLRMQSMRRKPPPGGPGGPEGEHGPPGGGPNNNPTRSY